MQSLAVRVQVEALRVKVFWYAYQKGCRHTARLWTRSARSYARARRSGTGANFLAGLPKKLYASREDLYAYGVKLNAYTENLYA